MKRYQSTLISVDDESVHEMAMHPEGDWVRRKDADDTITRLRRKLGTFAQWLDGKQIEAAKAYGREQYRNGVSDAYDAVEAKFWEIMEADGHGDDVPKDGEG